MSTFLNTTLERSSPARPGAMSENDISRWVDSWVESGDTELATQVLLESVQWMTYRDAEDAKQARTAWNTGGELLGAAACMMLERAEELPYHTVLMHRYHDVIAEGNAMIWAVLGRGEYIVLGQDAGVRLRADAAEWLEDQHKPVHAYDKVYRCIDLGVSGERWEETLADMLVLWKDAGGSFKREIDVYGSNVIHDDFRDAVRAYQSARMLDAGLED